MLADNLHVLPVVLKDDPLLRCFIDRISYLEQFIPQKMKELQELRWAYRDLYFEFHLEAQKKFLDASLNDPEQIKKQGDDYGRDMGWFVESEDNSIATSNKYDIPLRNYYERRTAQLEKVLQQIECELREYSNRFENLYRQYKPEDYQRIVDEVTGSQARAVASPSEAIEKSGSQKIEIRNSEVKLFLLTLHLTGDKAE